MQIQKQHLGNEEQLLIAKDAEGKTKGTLNPKPL